jgi:hypothetical protein
MKTFFLAACSLLFLNACALIELKKDLNFIEEKGSFGGEVIHPQNDKTSNIIVVFDQDKKIVAYKEMHPKDTYYVFMLPPNKVYRIYAYNDIDKDKKYDKIEPVGEWLNPKNITIEPGGFYEVQDIIIDNNKTIPPPL